MDLRALVRASVVLGVSCAMVHCGGVVERGGPPGSTPAPTTSATPTPTPSTPPISSPPPTTTRISIRVGHFSSRLPTLDVCISPDASSPFHGPLMRGVGATAGLAYKSVSRYFEVDVTAEARVRLVAAGGDCGARVARALGLSEDLPLGPFAPGARHTLGLLAEIGEGGVFAVPSLWRDEGVDGVDGGTMKVRVANAAEAGGNLDVAVNLGAGSEPLATNVAFGQVAKESTIGPVSSNGFVTVHAGVFGDAKVTLHDDPTSSFLVRGGFYTTQVQSAFVVGSFWDAKDPIDVVVCFDQFADDTSPTFDCQAMSRIGG